MKLGVQSLASLRGVSCDVGHRCGSGPMWLWLWCGLAAVAPIGPLAWELPYAMGTALKSERKKKLFFQGHIQIWEEKGQSSY